MQATTENNEEDLVLTSSRVSETHNVQYMAYHQLNMFASIEVTHHTAMPPEEVIAEGIKTIQHGFGLALLMIFKRYDENKSDAELNAYIKRLLPVALRITIQENHVLMDGIYMAAETLRRKELEKEYAAK